MAIFNESFLAEALGSSESTSTIYFINADKACTDIRVNRPAGKLVNSSLAASSKKSAFTKFVDDKLYSVTLKDGKAYTNDMIEWLIDKFYEWVCIITIKHNGDEYMIEEKEKMPIENLFDEFGYTMELDNSKSAVGKRIDTLENVTEVIKSVVKTPEFKGARATIYGKKYYMKEYRMNDFNFYLFGGSRTFIKAAWVNGCNDMQSLVKAINSEMKSKKIVGSVRSEYGGMIEYFTK